MTEDEFNSIIEDLEMVSNKLIHLKEKLKDHPYSTVCIDSAGRNLGTLLTHIKNKYYVRRSY